MNFCSRLSIADREPMAGTGVKADAYVFIPVDKRFWRSAEMNAGWASPEELTAIRDARRAGVVTRLYNPVEGRPSAVLVHPAQGRPEPVGLAALLAALGRWPLDDRGQPRLAICTHGTRDRCCAKFGFAAYNKALKLFDAGASPFEPLECSHLGGDRFAATGVFFPSGDMYAHLDDVDLPALCAAEAAGKLACETYRGRVFDPPLIQVVRHGLARAGLFDHATADLEILERAGAELRVSTGASEIVVTLDDVDVSFYGSCEKMEQARPSKGRRTVVTDARAVAPAG
jgi:hypothetical protein